jgi:hypothetical protein
VQQDQQRQKTAQAIASQRARSASQGADIGSGSDLDLVGDLARAGEFDADTIANDTQAKAYQYELAANSYAGRASLADSEASNDWLKFNNSLLGSSVNSPAKSLLAGGV